MVRAAAGGTYPGPANEEPPEPSDRGDELGCLRRPGQHGRWPPGRPALLLPTSPYCLLLSLPGPVAPRESHKAVCIASENPFSVLSRRNETLSFTLSKQHLILVHVPASLLASRGLTRPTWTLCVHHPSGINSVYHSHRIFYFFHFFPPSIGSMFPSSSSSASASPPSHPDPDPLHPPSSPRPALLPLRYVMDLLDVDSAATHPHLSAHCLAYRA